MLKGTTFTLRKNSAEPHYLYISSMVHIYHSLWTFMYPMHGLTHLWSTLYGF